MAATILGRANIGAYISQIYVNQTDFDDKTKDQNRTQIYKILAAIGTECGYDTTALGYLLSLKNIKGNGGLGDVTQHLKWTAKYHRTRGVHTTPTVFINGIEADDLSSR